MPEIKFEHVTKLYKHNKIGIEDISFEINRGEFVFFVGRSGSGKSTILKLITARIRPTEGKILIRDKQLEEMKKKEVPFFRRQFGILDKEFGLLPSKSVYENVEVAMKATQQPETIMEQRILGTLRSVGIEQKAASYPHEISTGEAARALLARALVMNPEILIADEPTANLDWDNSWDLMCLLDELNRLGVTVIVASHDRDIVSIMKKRVITLAAGTIVADEKRAIYDVTKSDIFVERRILDGRAKRKK